MLNKWWDLLRGPPPADEETGAQRDPPGHTACERRSVAWSMAYLPAWHFSILPVLSCFGFLRCSMQHSGPVLGFVCIHTSPPNLRGGFRPVPELVSKAKYFMNFVKSVYTQAYYWLRGVNGRQNTVSPAASTGSHTVPLTSPKPCPCVILCSAQCSLMPPRCLALCWALDPQGPVRLVQGWKQ